MQGTIKDNGGGGTVTLTMKLRIISKRMFVDKESKMKKRKEVLQQMSITDTGTEIWSDVEIVIED